MAVTATIPHELSHAFLAELANGDLLTDQQKAALEPLLDSLGKDGTLNEMFSRFIERLFAKTNEDFVPDTDMISVKNILKNVYGALRKAVTLGMIDYNALPMIVDKAGKSGITIEQMRDPKFLANLQDVVQRDEYLSMMYQHLKPYLEMLANSTDADKIKENVKKQAKAVKGNARADLAREGVEKKMVRDQALDRVRAAREVLKNASEQDKEQARKALRAAQVELAKANAEWDKVRRAKRANVAGAEGRFSLVEVDGEIIAVANGYALTTAESKDQAKVEEVLSSVIGQQFEQLGETIQVNVDDAFADEFWGSSYSQKIRSRREKIWRANVSAIPILNEILKTTNLGAAETAKHINKNYKNKATFYRCDAKFGVKRWDGVAKYPCQVLIMEVDGKRYVFDIVRIGKPTVTAKTNLTDETVRRLYDGTQAGGSVSRGIIPNSAEGLQGRNSLVTPDQAAEWMPNTKVVGKDGNRWWCTIALRIANLLMNSGMAAALWVKGSILIQTLTLGVTLEIGCTSAM